MASILDSKSWIHQFNQGLKRTGDTESEQAKLRIAIGFIVVIYIFLPWSTDESYTKEIISIGGEFFSLALIISFFYTSCSLAIFFAIALNPVASPVRRVAGTVLDSFTLSFLMFHSGEASVPLFFIYLWVILGNGFRFGVNYLYISQATSIVGFMIVILGGEYWQNNQSFAASLFMMLCLIPLYAAFLLKKLHAAIDMAKHANEAKSRFLANMSHELRTPLNGVIGMGDLLRETDLNYEQRELVGSMHSSANTLLELIENILDISKIEAGKVLTESKIFDLHSLVNTVLLMLAPLGEKKGLRVSCYFDPETPFELKGDQRYVHQVLVNLVNNAIKFTSQGSVYLSVRLIGGTRLNPVIRFEITDTGIGITKTSLERIFDNFTQADVSTSRSFGGTGLGTTISKELVELMGGTIGAESKENHGSKFWFELPFEAGNSQEFDSKISENRILLLANEDTAEIIRPFLKIWNIDFDWIRTSTRALSQLLQASDDNKPYETIIVDQSSLNDINAVQFAQMIKSENLLDSTTLVLINSSDTMIDANRTNQFYISTIENPEDKRLVFNAIHAALSVNLNDTKVVTMAEHYAKQAGVQSLNILVAEDNSVNQQVIRGILQNAGHKVQIASTGGEVLDIISENFENIEMLILDMNMPEVSGIEVIKSLRFMDTKSKIPTIMLTADATPEAKEASYNAGANKFLTKPIDSRELLDCIASLSRNTRRKKTIKIPSDVIKKHIRNNFPRSDWYDHNVLGELDILGGDADFVPSLLKTFSIEGAKHILNIKISLHDDDYLEYRESLHALKGSSTEIGAGKLVETCLEGEAIKPYDMGSEKIQRLSEDLEEIFNRTVTALDNAVTVYQKHLQANELSDR